MTCCIVHFAVPANHSENQRKRKKRRILTPCLRSKKDREHEGDGNSKWYAWNGSQRLRKRTGKVGNHWAMRNDLEYSIFCDWSEY